MAFWVEPIHLESNSGHIHVYFAILGFLSTSFPALPALLWIGGSFSLPFPVNFSLKSIHFQYSLGGHPQPFNTVAALPSPPCRHSCSGDSGEPVLCPLVTLSPPSMAPAGHRGDCWCLCRPGWGHCSERGWHHLRPAPLCDVLLDISGREYIPGGLCSLWLARPHCCQLQPWATHQAWRGWSLSSVLVTLRQQSSWERRGWESGRWWLCRQRSSGVASSMSQCVNCFCFNCYCYLIVFVLFFSRKLFTFILYDFIIGDIYIVL